MFKKKEYMLNFFLAEIFLHTFLFKLIRYLALF